MKILAVFGRNAYGEAARGEGYEHANILPDLEAIAGAGNVRLFDSWDKALYSDYAALNRALLAEVASFRPDVVFLVLMTHEIWTETLDAIRAGSPTAILNWGTDDSWKYAQMTRFLARHVDLHVSTDAAAVARASADGLDNVAQSQWAACAARLAPPLLSADCRYDVTFLGARYGNRPEWVAALADRGIAVTCFGKGWDGGVVKAEEIGPIFRASRVCLNFSDSGLQAVGGSIARSRQIKARTFEVPGAGGLLLTEPADGLERYYDIGREIATYESADELAALIRALLADPARRDEMARRGHERTAREHTYRARLPRLLEEAIVRAGARRPNAVWSLDPAVLDGAIACHRSGAVVRFAARALTGACRLALGADKGYRAARRFVHEASWRLAGAHTYSAGGWPGRMYYK